MKTYNQNETGNKDIK